MMRVFGHRFHYVCIRSWLRRVNKCPNCQHTALKSFIMDGRGACDDRIVAGRRTKRRAAVDSADRVGRAGNWDTLANVNAVTTADQKIVTCQAFGRPRATFSP